MTARSFTLLSGLVVCVFLVAAQGALAVDPVAKTYDIKDVFEVVTNNGHVQIVQGETEGLRVEAAQDVIGKVHVDLTGNKLTLKVKKTSNGLNLFNWFHNNHDKVTYILQLKHLHYLELNGTADVVLKNWTEKNLAINAGGSSNLKCNQLTVENLAIELSGASESQIQKINAGNIKYKLSGASQMNIDAESKATFLQINTGGASEMYGKLLQVNRVDAVATGASTIEISATDFLKVKATGASTVDYRGNPKSQIESSGASEVNAI